MDEGVDAGENGNDHDLENLRESVRQLSDEVARLQSDLNAAKLLEFETSEQNVNLTQVMFFFLWRISVNIALSLYCLTAGNVANVSFLIVNIDSWQAMLPTLTISLIC